MSPRPATFGDAPEVVRLAGIMYESMGVTIPATWAATAEAEFRSLLGSNLMAYVVDDDRPGSAGGLSASGCGLIHQRLPAPRNPGGLVGYIQWVCTDGWARRRGHSTRIIESLLAWFEQRSVATVELHATPDGEGVYRRLGFSAEGAVALRRRARDRG
jgi:Acetyltransferase (GNAT) family